MINLQNIEIFLRKPAFLELNNFKTLYIFGFDWQKDNCSPLCTSPLNMFLTPLKSFSEMMCRENVVSHRSPSLKTSMSQTIDNGLGGNSSVQEFV